MDPGFDSVLSPWYALQVRPRSEKTVRAILENKGFAPFLPTCGQASRSRRNPTAELPMFPGYLFCRLDLSSRILPLYTTPGFHRLVGAGRTPVEISQAEIDGIRLVMASGLASLPWPRIEPGAPVEVESGPLAGLRGVLLAIRKRDHLVVSVDLLQRAVAVELDACCVRPLRVSPASAVPTARPLRLRA